MKKSHILGIVVIGIAIMIFISTAGDASTYVDFAQAKSMAEDGSDKKIHVVGKLMKDSVGQVIGIETSADMLQFSFIMVDNNGKSQRVIFNEPMPADFLKSEQVVVVGAFHKENFVAHKILLKCPSKYEDETVEFTDV